jgi:phenylpropionate dioxygenase-like ring-hydroxylating dioxygenase large terminal subunit
MSIEANKAPAIPSEDTPGERIVPGEHHYQSLLDQEVRPVPVSLRATSAGFLDHADIAPTRYFSAEFHDREVERVWRRTWQMACREEQIPRVGDVVVYEVADASLLVVRAAEDEIRAFHNSCLHRGTQLRTSSGRVNQFRCPFHGFTWNLDGTLAEVPCAWDFPQIDPATFCLPEAQVGTWGGFVFVNFDPQAPPLAEYLEDLPWHFAAWPMEDRYLTAHIVRVMPCNWKVALEAFIEAYHTMATHPQLLKTAADTQTEYDVYGPHVSRMITAVGIRSEHLEGEPDEEAIVRAMLGRDGGNPVEEGASARQVLADRVRRSLHRRTGRDYSELTDAEALDGIEYFLFPNFMPWAGMLTPFAYRFRPDGNDPDSCVIDIMQLEPVPAIGPRPAPAPTRYLGPDESWGDVAELGAFGRVFNQDGSTFGRIQRGLRASVVPTIALGRYQESRIRHFHATLDAYIAGRGIRASGGHAIVGQAE